MKVIPAILLFLMDWSTTLSIGFLIVLGLLVVVFVLYRRNRSAYRNLVRKSQEWANVPFLQHLDLEPKPPSETHSRLAQLAETPDETDLSIMKAETPDDADLSIMKAETPDDADLSIMKVEIPDETDLSIMKSIEELFAREMLYKNAMLSLDSLATRLSMKRHVVSRTINRCTGKYFHTFINEYRIKEAIKLLSEKRTKPLSMESVAFDSGFNDRRNFNRVFKKITGLSPTDFVNNSIRT